MELLMIEETVKTFHCYVGHFFRAELYLFLPWKYRAR
jgi:hypothetical protein